MQLQGLAGRGLPAALLGAAATLAQPRPISHPALLHLLTSSIRTPTTHHNAHQQDVGIDPDFHKYRTDPIVGNAPLHPGADADRN